MRYDPRSNARTDGDAPAPTVSPSIEPGAGRPRDSRDASLGELFSQLTTDMSALVAQEVHLAKVELRESGARIARDTLRVGAAAAVALAGALALTAFLVAGLGALLGAYWLGALIVGVVLLAGGALWARAAAADLTSRDVRPDETARTLREDAAWAGREARAVKRELTR